MDHFKQVAALSLAVLGLILLMVVMDNILPKNENPNIARVEFIVS